MPGEPTTQRTLTPIAVVGERAFHYFENNLTHETVRVPCTLEEYASLGLPNAGPASNGSGFTWLKSTREPKYDTPDGDLTADTYAILDSGFCVIKLAEDPDSVVRVVNASEVNNHIVEITSVLQKEEK